jgi:hypothetical protein
MSRRIALLSLALFAIAPAAAQAAPASPFRDRVLDPSGGSRPTGSPTASAAQAGAQTIAVPTKEGYSVPVTFTKAVPVDPALAASYVGFLDALPHGTELAKLKLQVAAIAEVAGLCGAQPEDGVLACYGNRTMTVPSTGLQATTEDGTYSTAYELTHEYGHHIAAYRANELYGLGAIDMGPKYWSSYERVCDQAIDKRLFPGYEGTDIKRYHANPGEDWAEAYARLTFPDQRWTFSPRLVPDATALDAVRRDVLTPWTRNTTATFTMAAGRDRQAFSVPLTLDGSLSATITGPKGSEVSVAVSSGSQKVAGDRKPRTGARDVWRISSGCRERATETLTFLATRTGGTTGPVQLTVSYPG